MNNTQKRILILSLVCIIALFICVFGIYQIYHTPKIILNGNETITINLYEKYNEMGAIAYNHDKNLTKNIEISDNINENIPGEYKVTYKLKNTIVERNVVVKDNVPPTLTLNGKDKIYLEINSKYIEEGATAIDNIDGDITDRIEITGDVDITKAGKYVITYTVKDNEGNETSLSREVYLQEPAPKIVRDTTTYVKISISNQTIEVYKDNVLVISSSIVTGTENYTDSDKGTFMIYSKSRNVYLKGTGYLSYVNYWMPYNGGEGLHDATWRQEFGGEIYKTNGSHGCINMPLDIAEQVYNIVKVGTTVEVY